MMKKQPLTDMIYNHEYLRKILGLLKSIKRNNNLETIVELCEKNEIEEDEELFNIFLNELNNICKYNDSEEEKEEKNDDITLYDNLNYMNSSSYNLEEINNFEMESNASSYDKNKIIRIYADGVFDLVHSGHFNAMRQAKKLGDVLVVGINSDDDVLKSKGFKPIYTQEERAELIRGCKWVDEVIVGTKYDVDMELLEKYNCDYAAHGNDLACDCNGNYCYEDVKKHNKLKIFERSYGISSTTLVNHLLQAINNGKTNYSIANKITSNEIKDSKNVNNSSNNSSSSDNNNRNNNNINNNNINNNNINNNNINNNNINNNNINNNNINNNNINNNNINNNNPYFNKKNIDSIEKEEEKTIKEVEDNKINPYEGILNVKNNFNRNRYYMTASRLYQFIDNNEKKKKKKIVYVDGSFDIFHIGHLQILNSAKKLGDYLIVGVHDDEVVRKMKGEYFPVTSLLERTLNVLAMKVVDDVIIGAPWVISENFIKLFHIDVVVRGTVVDYVYFNNEIDPYTVPKKLNIYKEISSQSSITTFEIFERIKKNKKHLMSSISKRCKKEETIWKVNNSHILT